MAEGFDGRIFLTDAEHATYLRRMPVRYLHHKRKTLCEVCGLPGTDDNPLQLAHIIGFSYGIKELKLTPDYLDKAENTKTAHRAVCNKAVELDVTQAREFIKPLLASL
jgi:hypothetical protein